MLASIAADTSSLDFIDKRPLWCVLLDPRGRIPRSTYRLLGIGTLSGLGLFGHRVLGIARVRPEIAEQIVNALLTWPPIATTAQRWHSRSKSGSWALLMLIPAIG